MPLCFSSSSLQQAIPSSLSSSLHLTSSLRLFSLHPTFSLFTSPIPTGSSFPAQLSAPPYLASLATLAWCLVPCAWCLCASPPPHCDEGTAVTHSCGHRHGAARHGTAGHRPGLGCDVTACRTVSPSQFHNGHHCPLSSYLEMSNVPCSTFVLIWTLKHGQ